MKKHMDVNTCGLETHFLCSPQAVSSTLHKGTLGSRSHINQLVETVESPTRSKMGVDI